MRADRLEDRKTRVAYHAGESLYIIEMGSVEGLAYGRLLNLDAPGLGPLVPLVSIAAHMPQTNFEPFEGDEKPILEQFQQRSQG